MSTKLAIHGGTPVREMPFAPWPVWDEKEENLLLDVLHSGHWGMLSGNKVKQFEQVFADYQQAKHGVAVANGTAALEIALRAIGIGLGDQVITTPYSFVATTNAVLMLGAEPVFVDIDPNTFCIDATQIEASIGEQSKAILPVHIAGHPADLDAIRAIAEKYGLYVVEDACQAWGAEWRGQRVGAIGDLGTFSFQASKNITAGEGGIIVTNDDELYDTVWSLHNVGRRQGGAWYEHVRQGWNFRLTEWQGAILLAQMARADELAQRRQSNAAYLADLLGPISGISPLKVDPRVSRHAWHIFIFRYASEAFNGMSREVFLRALQAEGIPCGPGYIPLNQSPAVLDGLNRLKVCYPELASPNPCPVAERICTQEAVWIPQNVLLGAKADVEDVAKAIAKIQASA